MLNFKVFSAVLFISSCFISFAQAGWSTDCVTCDGDCPFHPSMRQKTEINESAGDLTQSTHNLCPFCFPRLARPITLDHPTAPMGKLTLHEGPLVLTHIWPDGKLEHYVCPRPKDSKLK